MSVRASGHPFATHWRSISARCTVAVTLLLAATAGQAVDVLLLDAQYSTDLYYTYMNMDTGERTTFAQAQSADAPFTAEILGHGTDFARANADTFSVQAGTSTHLSGPFDGEHASASAESLLTFRALSNFNGPIDISFVGTGQSGYTAGLVSLYDVTSGASVFSYSWDCCYDLGNVPWTGPYPWLSADASIDQTFSGSHVYELHLWTKSFSNNDQQSFAISVSGFQPIASPVPEPEAFTLALAGLLGVGVAVRRQGRKR